MKPHSVESSVEPFRPARQESPLYFDDIVELRLRDGPDSEEFREARVRWGEKRFETVHYEHYSKCVPAGVVEVTPKRPPYDYRGQGGRRWFHRKDTPNWHYWRETFVTNPSAPCYAELNVILNSYSDLYLRCTYYTDPEDSAYCHRLLRPGLRECIDAYADWCPEHIKEADRRRLSAIRSRYCRVEAMYFRCAARRTVTQYSFGMLLGIILIPLVIWLNNRAFLLMDELLSPTVALPVGLDVAVHLGCAMGGVGAACSVLARINSATIDLDKESTRHGFYFWLNPVMQRGIARIVIGALFGGAAAWLLYARVFLPSVFLGASEERLVLTGVAAFVAGFSERFIPDVILRKAKPDQ